MFEKHRSWFPAILIVLSLALAMFVVWAFMIKSSATMIATEEIPAVTFEQYKLSAKQALGVFISDFANQAHWEERLTLASEAEQNLLALLVPSEGRAVHFELVSALELIKQGLVGQPEKLTEGQARLDRVLAENFWLR